MQKQQYITEFNNEEAFDNAFDNLSFPNVSHLVEEGEVRYSEEHPYMITGKSTYTAPFTLSINGTSRTVTLEPTTGDWEINIKPYMPLTGLDRFMDNKSSASAVNFPNSFDTSSVTTMNRMFASCQKLTSLPDISGWNVGNVSDMGGMFTYCTSLTSLPDISGWNVSNVTTMNSMFYNCSKLTSFPDISGWNVGNVTKMGGMFKSCYSLTSFPDISGWNVGNVTEMGEMLYNCSKLTSFPDISGWNTSSVTTMNRMFGSCSKLTTIEGLCEIGDGTKSVDTASMFYGCSSLTTINNAGAIHNTVSFSPCPLTLDSAKVVLNALSTPYNGAQTLTFSSTTKGYINADSEALAIVAEKQAIGWTIAL